MPITLLGYEQVPGEKVENHVGNWGSSSVGIWKVPLDSLCLPESPARVVTGQCSIAPSLATPRGLCAPLVFRGHVYSPGALEALEELTALPLSASGTSVSAGSLV